MEQKNEQQVTSPAAIVKTEIKKNDYKYKSKHPKPKLEFPTTQKGDVVDLKFFSNMLKDEKSRKFYFHLINAFCNKRYIVEDTKPIDLKCSILNLPIDDVAIKSRVSNVVLSKKVYDVLYRHIMSQCFVNRAVKAIVQETKRIILINDIADFLDIPASELNYDVLGEYTSQACKKVESMLHLHDRSGLNRNYKNGRVKAAIELLTTGPIPIKDDEVVRLEHPLIFDKYIPWPSITIKFKGSSSTTLGDVMGAELLAKLKGIK